jgi:hypothetical protein
MLTDPLPNAKIVSVRYFEENTKFLGSVVLTGKPGFDTFKP